MVLNEQTMTATLVVNADLGNYSAFLGSSQMLPNGNLAFTSGFLGTAGQSIEVLPNGTRIYVLQMNMPGLAVSLLYLFQSLRQLRQRPRPPCLVADLAWHRAASSAPPRMAEPRQARVQGIDRARPVVQRHERRTAAH